MSLINDRVSVIVLSVLLLTGCAGRAAYPVMVYQYGDEERSCDAIERELELIREDILMLMPQTDKADKNTQLGVAGIFFLIPFFFMDLSKAEQVEINALIKRHNHLLKIGELNSCDFEQKLIPDFKKTEY